MDRTIAFRRGLQARLLRASVITLPIGAVAGAACGASVIVDPSAGAGGASTTSTSAGGAGGATTTTTTTLVQSCFGWAPDAGACPDQEEAPVYITFPTNSCSQLVSGGVLEGAACCYEIQLIKCLGTGRPYVDGGRPQAASPRPAEDPRDWSAGVEAERVAHLDPALRAHLAEAWAADGLLEHASIASFGRFAFELLAVGAPADLVAQAHRAALDEVHHARLCLGLAAAYGGRAVAPSPFPFRGKVEVSHDLAGIAARAAREGCVGEALSAVQAAEQLAVAEDPRVRAALSVIAPDEARHAELAFRFVAWAIARGGPEVRAAVARAFAAEVELPAGAPCPEGAIAHGRLGPAALRAALARALDEVVRPSAERLLAA